MARFHVRDSFPAKDKTAFVLAGFVIEGDVAAGMSLRLPFKENVMITAQIDRMESLRRPDGEVVCLCIRCAVPEEAILWEALKIKDRTVDIIQSGSA